MGYSWHHIQNNKFSALFTRPPVHYVVQLKKAGFYYYILKTFNGFTVS